MGSYFMAIDAGTGSVRAVLFDTMGNQLFVSQQEWEHREDPRYPGSMDFDWTHNWALASGCVRDVLKKSGINPAEILGISTTSMREGIVLYDKEGNEIWACANVDARAGAEVGELKQLSPALEAEIYMQSGQTYALGALPRLLWVKNHLPEVYERTAAINMFNDWLVTKLTGAITAEPSNGCTTGIFDLSKRAWLPEIAEKCGLRGDIFPPVTESGSIAGKVSKACAELTGLKEGTPVITGGGDVQFGGVGVGLVSEHQAALFGGSFWQYVYNTASCKMDKDCRVRVNCHAVPGLWQYEAIAFFPGLIMRWYRDAFCQLEKLEGEKQGKDAYYLMDKEAEKIPAGSYGLMCTFSDVMNYIAWRHAAPSFVNFSLDAQKFNRYTFYRAIMENAALVTKGNLELVREVTGSTPTEIIFAGGACKSPVWCQIVADVLGLKVRVPKAKEATALGAAITASFGVGYYSSMKEAADKMVQWDKEYLPNPENQKVYQGLYETWRKVYAQNLTLADEKLTNYMWAAPGL